MKYSFFIFFLFTFTFLNAQHTKKIVEALRIDKPPKIDGILNEDFWKNAEPAENFVMVKPGDGDAEPETQKTVVKVAYTNEAIFFAAYLFDSNPGSIMKQLSDRDIFAQSDVFGVAINPYNDEQNETEFFVSAGGTQADAKVSSAKGEDFSWNDVWFSEISFDEHGWYVEMEIPYSALRFSKNKEQIWGINFFRLIQSTREQYSWNYIDKSTGKFSQYEGLLTNIKDLKAPVRLNFLPTSTTNITNYKGTSVVKEQFGMDLRYGLTDNFTLNLTINPDFSLTGFDNLVLNLSPFETFYNEQRQFFIEGSEILNKGDLFFSRRIGKQPINFNNVETTLTKNETILKNPEITKIIGAVKISGRTKKGLGIAILDAVTNKTEAIIKDTINSNTRKIITEPITNYNVFVIDQEFNKNSSITFVNTNVARSGNYRNANSSAFLLSLANKANSKLINGYVKWNTIKDGFNGNSSGYATGLSFDKTKGNFRYGFKHRLANATYNINDLGFQQRNNYNAFFGSLSYEIFKSTKHFYTYKIGLDTGLFRRFNPDVYSGNFVNLNFFATTLSQFSFGGSVNSSFGKQKDFYEPRDDINFYMANPDFNFSGFVSSDFRKKFAYNAYLSFYKRFNEDEIGYTFGVTPIFRANDHFNLSYSIDYQKFYSQRGYVTTLNDNSIIFGVRDNKSIVNTITGKYSFNDLASLSIAFRYNWSPVNYKNNYYLLNKSGYLTTTNYIANNNVNFNSWNFDLKYVWQFSRGSELAILYRNSIFKEDNQSQLPFTENLNNLFQESLQQNLSIRLVYYLDYNKLKT